MARPPCGSCRPTGYGEILYGKTISENLNIGIQRETFFFNQMRVNNDVMTSKTGDFRIKDYVFEVGDKNKVSKQISEEKNSIVVKDDIEYGQKGFIPSPAFRPQLLIKKLDIPHLLWSDLIKYQ